jgi:signal transduction histidine kinase
VIAVVITSILMSLALSWLLNLATNNIHNAAMQEQAASVAHHLVAQADGSISLELPPDLQGLYSQPYGRYSYAVVDDRGNTLFSSLKDGAPIFPADPKATAVQFLQMRKGDAAISGASIRRAVGTRTVWVQAAEDLANRDVLIDDIVSDFFKNVGWITLPILLVLLATDIAIFRRALLPLRQASETAQQIGPAHTDVRLPVNEIPSEVRPLVSAVNQALDRLDQGFRIQREFTADAAHELRTPLSILRTRVDTLEDQRFAEALHQDIEAMSRIVGQLLDIAELDAFTIDPLDLADARGV